MRKILLIIGTVAVLIGVTVYADRATRVKPRSSLDHPDRVDASGGTPAPEATFKDLDGKDVPLSQFKGKVVLVNFWATWCEPCQVKFPGSSKCNRSTRRRASPFLEWTWMMKAITWSPRTPPRNASM